MPNWCSTGITFYSQNEKSLRELYERLKKIYYGKPTRENDFGHGWMGDYANSFYPKIGAEHIDCRGYIGYWDDDGLRRQNEYFVFSIWTETAWGAKVGLWSQILNDFYPDISMAYIAEECGCCYYVKWDETGLFYPMDYYVDMCYPLKDGGEEYIEDHGFSSLNEIYDWLDKNLPFQYERKESAEELDAEIISKFDEYDSDELYCVIAKYYEIAPSEFDFKN